MIEKARQYYAVYRGPNIAGTRPPSLRPVRFHEGPVMSSVFIFVARAQHPASFVTVRCKNKAAQLAD